MSDNNAIATAVKKTLLQHPEYGYKWVISKKVKRGSFWSDVLDNYPKGFPKPKDKDQISSYYSKDKTAIIGILESDPDIKHLRESVSETDPDHNAQDAQSEALPTYQTLQIDSDLESKITEMVAKAIAEQLSGQSIPKHYEHTELVPEPTTVKGGSKGRRLNRLYWKKTISIDRTLWTLFEKEAKDLKIPVSRLIDSILWLRYGKPDLTYD